MIGRLLTDLMCGFSQPVNLTEDEWLTHGLKSVFGSMVDANSSAGVNVTHASSMQLGAVWQAVSMISGDAALCPLHVYKRIDDNFREIDREHPAEFLCSVRPNEEMAAFEFWRRHLIHSLLWQNGYIWIQRRGRVGEPIGLYNLLPDRTFPKRFDNGNLYYETEVGHDIKTREKKVLLPHEVIHTKGVTIDNDYGLDLVTKARDAWGLALAAQGFASKFFANGAGSGGILEIPIGFSEKAAKNLEEGFRKRTGPDEWFKTAILRDGAKFHATTISPKDAELTGLSEVQVRQVARFFNLPPFKLGLEDSNAYNSSEMAQLIYLMSCLNHWLAAVRDAAKVKLLTETEMREFTHFMAHNTSVIIETDTKTLNEVLAIQRQNKIINAQEWRAKLNLPPRDDPDADSYENPNTDRGDGGGATPAGNGEPQENGEPTDAMRRLVKDAVARQGRRIAAIIDGNESKWPVRETEQRSTFREALRPVADVVGEAVGGDGAALCGEWEAEFFSGLATLLRPDNTLDRGEALGQVFPAAIAARIGESNGHPANQLGAA